MKTRLTFYFLILIVVLSACGWTATSEPPALTPPAISVQITKGNCPSIEIEPGMQIIWTNMDDVDRILIAERVDENGVFMDSGGTDLLQPGDSFSLILTESGQYTYYCSMDRKEFGSINVK